MRHRVTRPKPAAAVAGALALVLVLAVAATAGAASSTPAATAAASASNGATILHLQGGRSTSFGTASRGPDATAKGGELRPGVDVDGAGEVPGGSVVNRAMSHGHGGPFTAPTAASTSLGGATPALSWDGINHRDQRLANGGNQFSLEPPDQGLCVGNGFVLETVNDALRVYTTGGTPVTGTVALNQFLGYAPEIVRGTPTIYGPEPTDPSCFYDPDTQRWFHIVLTLEVDPSTGDLTGPNHLDLSVSKTSDPTGGWFQYTLQVANDNSPGTGNHPQCPCLGDYPHIGFDKYGIYITTNEYSLFKDKFNGAQIYAISKRALEAGNVNTPVLNFDHLIVTQSGTNGFTVWPAESPGTTNYESANGGTEYFLSSMAAEETKNKTGFANQIAVWALTNTSSLDSGSPDVALSNRPIDSETYGQPPDANQKPGPTPLADCLNDTTTPTIFGPGCWQLLLTAEPAHDETEGPIAANDTRMQQVYFVGGLLYSALNTAVSVGGSQRAGIAWFIVHPTVSTSGDGGVNRTSVDGTVVKQGYLAQSGNNVVFPAIAVREDGKGVMAFTLVGNDHFPTAAWSTIDSGGVGSINVAREGVGPQDGFSEYKAFSPTGNGVPRPRWGDYGAAVTDGSAFWIASEYIGQSCTYSEYYPAPPSPAGFGSCGGTRTSLANWYTRISQVSR